MSRRTCSRDRSPASPAPFRPNGERGYHSGMNPDPLPVAPAADCPEANPVRRWHYLLLALLAALALAYLSLLPFHLRDLSFAEAWQFFRQIVSQGWSRPYSKQDVAVNVLVTVPLAYALMGALLLRCRRPALVLPAAGLTLLVVLGLSVSVEFGQLWVVRRVCSPRDVAAQFAGGVIGCGLWIAFGAALTARLDEFLRTREPATRLDLLFSAYVLGLVVWSLLPFDFVTSLHEIARKFRRGQIEIVPFTFPYPSRLEFWYAMLADAALFVPVGVWCTRAFRPRAAARRDFWPALVLAFAVNVAIESAQLLIASRYTSSTDVLIGTAGALLGILGAVAWGRAPRRRKLSANAGFWCVLAIMYSAVLACLFWTPFEVSRDPAFLHERLRQFVALPFSALQASGSDVGAMFHVLRDFGWFVPLGALCALAVDRARVSPGTRLVLSCLGMLYPSLVGVVIEAGELAMPAKTADLAEVLVRGLGGAGGFVIAMLIVRHWTPGRR